ncbi:hypothetical protein EI42_04057 [Thermosporothrix hazakensis]|uniref:Uncharacterized protein n=1 Tax=Thermosporothrix hazakensis TaxID=644383 RepID=A0A326U2V5_THEHA|nr:hypothetical protein [Thermosporothrix hazakensis]PZW26098.1 hypothetical protein EI42_04057 [Thermosporothrix hazakensis]GCE51358.1 hypothetical protein KTH_62270 [Thermosporothrix hazakensis]
MPRYIPYQIKWSEQNQRYEFLLDGLADSWALRSEWLEQIPSFSFQSRSGSHYTARKETKQRGGTYWCGYRRTQERIIKRYIGKCSYLSLSLLEDIAHSFAKPSRPALLSSSAESQSFPKLERQTNRLRAPSRTTPRRASFPLLLSKLSPQLVERSRLLTPAQ